MTMSGFPSGRMSTAGPSPEVLEALLSAARAATNLPLSDVAPCSHSLGSSAKRQRPDEFSERIIACKKQRLTWTGELHARFLAAVKALGVSNAVPQKILNLMNVKGLTRDQVASHLQKYRLHLKRLAGLADDAVLDVDTVAMLQQIQDDLLSTDQQLPAPTSRPEVNSTAHKTARVSPFAMPAKEIEARLTVALQPSKNESSDCEESRFPRCTDYVSDDRTAASRSVPEESSNCPVVNFLPIPTAQGLLLIPLSVCQQPSDDGSQTVRALQEQYRPPIC